MKTQGEVQGVSALARSAQEIAQQAAAASSKHEKELAEVMHQMKTSGAFAGCTKAEEQQLRESAFCRTGQDWRGREESTSVG